MTLRQKVDRESPLPLYAQVKRKLRTAILSWPSDSDRFHTEQTLCAMYGVSRATIRQATSELEEEGLLRRRQGVGTVVNRRKIDESFPPLANFSDQWAQSGRSLKIELLGLDRSTACPAPFSEMLCLPPGGQAARIQRARLSGAMRIAWDLRYVPMEMVLGVSRRELVKGSLLDMLARKVKLDRVESLLEAGLAGDEYAERLELLPHDPILVRHMTYFAVNGRPMMAGLSVYRADQVRYKLSAPMQSDEAALRAEVRISALAA